MTVAGVEGAYGVGASSDSGSRRGGSSMPFGGGRSVRIGSVRVSISALSGEEALANSGPGSNRLRNVYQVEAEDPEGHPWLMPFMIAECVEASPATAPGPGGRAEPTLPGLGGHRRSPSNEQVVEQPGRPGETNPGGEFLGVRSHLPRPAVTIIDNRFESVVRAERPTR